MGMNIICLWNIRFGFTIYTNQMIKDDQNYQKSFDTMKNLLSGIPYRYHMRVHTMFNLIVPPTWGIKGRKNSDLHIALVKDGSGHYLLEKDKDTLEKGKVIFVSNNYFHGSYTDPEDRVYLSPIRFGIYDNVTKKQIEYPCEPFAFSYFPKNYVKHKQLYESLFRRFMNVSTVSKTAYESAILSQIMLLTMNDLKLKSDTLFDDQRIGKIKEYIDSHPARHFTTEELAEMAELSGKYFIRLFKTSTGFTPCQYIIRRRIEHSQFLLQETEMKINEIAAFLGYPDQFSFSKQFKSITGFTPSNINSNH